LPRRAAVATAHEETAAIGGEGDRGSPERLEALDYPGVEPGEHGGGVIAQRLVGLDGGDLANGVPGGVRPAGGVRGQAHHLQLLQARLAPASAGVLAGRRYEDSRQG